MTGSSDQERSEPHITLLPAQWRSREESAWDRLIRCSAAAS